MLKIGILCFLFTFSTVYGKIYDCFLFLNEYEVLEIRLNTLDDHVDKFVLVEARETFKGNPKPLYFEENKHLYSKFADKIIHVVIDEHFETTNPWLRETYQRNQIARALHDCEDEDVIFVSDVDEIVHPECIDQICLALEQGNPAISCQQPIYRYYLNRKDEKGSDWHGTVAVYYKQLGQISPQKIRELRNSVPYISDAGWHFTAMGGYDRVVEKLYSFSHSQAQHESPIPTKKKFRDAVEQHSLVDIDTTYPAFVQENIPYLIDLELIDVQD